jgi:hypothetical protein
MQNKKEQFFRFNHPTIRLNLTVINVSDVSVNPTLNYWLPVVFLLKPQEPLFLLMGSIITPNIGNNTHMSYVRNTVIWTMELVEVILGGKKVINNITQLNLDNFLLIMFFCYSRSVSASVALFPIHPDKNA